MNSPIESLPAFEDAFEDVLRDQANASKILEEQATFHVTFTGEFGPHKVSPRALSASLLGGLVQVHGIITRCTLVRPKLVQSVHWCPATDKMSTREYRDVTSHRGLPTSTVYPTRDEDGNLLTTQFGLSRFVDQQTITLQELPETSPPGQLPRSVEVILEGDLRDAAKPGDRVSVVGVYKPISPSANGSISGVFRAVIVATGVSQLSAEAIAPTFTEVDYDNITALAEEPDLMDQLASSLAPSIYGYGWIKKALVLLLAGGRERTLPNGTHLRGDLNCLMVGDPGVAKSQLLRAIMNIAPLCVSTTGRGSSGVGLTAAVVTDQDTGERRLEAGAMVLADRGIVTIDEFDKMNDADRVAIHEVMEQQTVTIAKAGIMTQLNARCSVVAAANPIYGHYDRTISITRNIGLPDSLLSRFDLLFVVLDNNDAARDREIANHVLGQHRYRGPGEDGKFVADDTLIESLEDDERKSKTETEIRVRYDTRLYGPRKPGQKDPLSVPFLRKYLAFAKQRFAAPELTPEATEAIAEYYAELRNSAEVKALPVTVRTLETLIRLSCAHAKVRLSPFVEISDVEEVTALIDMILKSDPSAQEVRRANARRQDGRVKRPRGDTSSDDDNDDDDLGDGVERNETEGNEAMETSDDEFVSADGGPGSSDAVAVESDAVHGPSASSPGGKHRQTIRSVVLELAQHNSDLASVTGLLSELRSRQVKTTRKQIMEVLQELHDQDRIILDGEDFFITS